MTGLLAAKAALRSPLGFDDALEALVRSVSETLGFAVAALNLLRPATHEFEVVVVHGSDDARAALLGTRSAVEGWEQLLGAGFEHEDCRFVPAGSIEDDLPTWTPEILSSSATGSWLAGDELCAVLRGADGRLLGILSVDDPVDGLRPTADVLDALGGLAFQAGLVLHAADAAERASANRVAVQTLLSVSADVHTAATVEAVGAIACSAIRDALGFERVVMALANGDVVSTVAQVGRDDDPTGPWAMRDLSELLRAVDPEHGCALMTLEQAQDAVPDLHHHRHPSVNNGRGPQGWNRHWLVVPLLGEDGAPVGFLWPDDPRDRLRPSVERLQTLRAFANQAAAAVEARRAADRLTHLAAHDPLTGLRNRRDLTAQIDALMSLPQPTPASVAVLDPDQFKRVNDELGNQAGDRVLRVIAEAIRAVVPHGAVTARLGGEEFAFALPLGGELTARTAAEEIRRRVAAHAEVPWGLRISAGVAVQRAGEDAEALLRHASRALEAAKRLGRDRVVAYDGATIEPLLAALTREDAEESDQLAAVMLLAEALDLRDAGTARHSRTVARYSQALAEHLGLDRHRVERVRVAGLLHDVGKLAVPDRILHKPGPLDADEWEVIRSHPEVGARIVASGGLRDVAEWVRAHHESWDGRGYPERLGGAAIPLEARILAVADAYEAMTAVRPYNLRPRTPRAAREELRRCSGSQFDPQVVDAFLQLFP